MTDMVKTASFSVIRTAIGRQFQSMVATGLFYVEIDKDLLWDTYLASFPDGANPLYRERTEHDCSACKSFVRTLGGVVTIKNNALVTIWDCDTDDVYQPVVDTLAALVRSRDIANVFLHREPSVGVAKNFEQTTSGVVTREHFHVNLPAAAYCKGVEIGPKQSASRADHDVLLRSLQEIDIDSIDTVLELIDQNSLYRGEENRFAVAEFRKLKQAYVSAANPDLFAWEKSRSVTAAVARIRNTAIGALLSALATGEEMESAVKSFEAMVAPTNYKRPTALVTKAMIAKAQETIEQLGFTTALERRYATIEDITVNNVLFADRRAKREMNVFDELASQTTEKDGKHYDRVEEVSIDVFLTKILPKAESVEVLFENRHAPNLVSLIAPVDPTARSMFKWPNNFSWAYAGEVADSIKERVKRAGGSVTGDLCCRLAWNNTDDLDFHMKEPGGGTHIYYACRRQLSAYGGMLDLDANGADGPRTDPAENIVYADRHRMREGLYELSVHQYARRQTANDGFEVEVEFDGRLFRMAYDRPMSTGVTVAVATIKYTRVSGFEIVKSLPSSSSSKTVWGLATQSFRRVRAVMLSPNHWDERAVGNKHYFFMLEDCVNEERARGFFNEFLNEELNAHRKVLEVVGAKLKTEESNRQLSGLGFSSTQRNSVLCRVQGAFSRTIRIAF
jgi:hypothetical protein